MRQAEAATTVQRPMMNLIANEHSPEEKARRKVDEDWEVEEKIQAWREGREPRLIKPLETSVTGRPFAGSALTFFSVLPLNSNPAPLEGRAKSACKFQTQYVFLRFESHFLFVLVYLFFSLLSLPPSLHYIPQRQD